MNNEAKVNLLQQANQVGYKKKNRKEQQNCRQGFRLFLEKIDHSLEKNICSNFRASTCYKERQVYLYLWLDPMDIPEHLVRLWRIGK